MATKKKEDGSYFEPAKGEKEPLKQIWEKDIEERLKKIEEILKLK